MLAFREICDQDRLTAYVNAFSECQLPSELLKWVSIRAGTEENLSNQKLMTPKALISMFLSIFEYINRFDFAYTGSVAYSVLPMRLRF